VQVFGGGSMGALRARSWPATAWSGGRIFAGFRDGTLTGDDEVRCSHAGAADRFRPLTVPLVDVRRAVAEARAPACDGPPGHRAGGCRRGPLLPGPRLGRLVDAARLPAATARPCAASSLAPPRRRRRTPWPRCERPSPGPGPAVPAPPAAATPPTAPADPGAAAGADASGPASARPRWPAARCWRRWRHDPRPDACRRRPDAPPAHRPGRALGLTPGHDEVDDAEARWLAGLGVGRRSRDAFLAASALDEGEASRLAEGLRWRRAARRGGPAIPDGPGWLEGWRWAPGSAGVAAEAARLCGLRPGRPGLRRRRLQGLAKNSSWRPRVWTTFSRFWAPCPSSGKMSSSAGHAAGGERVEDLDGLAGRHPGIAGPLDDQQRPLHPVHVARRRELHQRLAVPVEVAVLAGAQERR